VTIAKVIESAVEVVERLVEVLVVEKFKIAYLIAIQINK